MNNEEMYLAMEQGEKVRRPCWHPTAYMILNSEGFEETYVKGKLVAMGYRFFNDWNQNDFEVVK